MRDDNLTQGIALGYNTVSAVGTNANVDLVLQAKGAGLVSFPGQIDIGLELVKCANVASGSDCSCPAGKRALGGGSYGGDGEEGEEGEAHGCSGFMVAPRRYRHRNR